MRMAMRMAAGMWVAVLASVLGWASAPAWAAFTCPPTVLDRGAVTLPNGGVDPPWARHPFRNVSFYDGDPHGLSDLPPNGEEMKPDRIVQSWTFAGTGRITAVCRYSGSKRTVQAALPSGTKHCTLVTLKTGAQSPDLSCE